MIGAVFAFLRSPLGGWAVGALAAVGLLIAWRVDHSLLESQRDSARAAEKVARNDLATCRGNTHRLEAAIAAQNRAVEALAEKGRTMEAAAQKATERASEATARAKAEAAKSARRPIKGATSCDRVKDVAAVIRKDL